MSHGDARVGPEHVAWDGRGRGREESASTEGGRGARLRLLNCAHEAYEYRCGPGRLWCQHCCYHGRSPPFWSTRSTSSSIEHEAAPRRDAPQSAAIVAIVARRDAARGEARQKTKVRRAGRHTKRVQRRARRRPTLPGAAPVARGPPHKARAQPSRWRQRARAVGRPRASARGAPSLIGLGRHSLVVARHGGHLNVEVAVVRLLGLGVHVPARARGGRTSRDGVRTRAERAACAARAAGDAEASARPAQSIVGPLVVHGGVAAARGGRRSCARAPTRREA